MNPKGKNVLVTGGSRGIGSAIARAFAGEGSNVLVNYLNSESYALALLDEVGSYATKVFTYRADVSSREQVEDMFSYSDHNMGDLDVLVNNAGWTEYVDDKDLRALSPQLFSRILDVNLMGTFLCSAAALERMTERATECNIVNIASTAALTGLGSNIAYCAAKAGVVSLTKSLARAFGPRIRVNCIAPGLTETDMTREKSPPECKQVNISMTPLGRISRPEDIARVVVALVRDMDFVNGETIVVDGGKILNG